MQWVSRFAFQFVLQMLDRNDVCVDSICNVKGERPEAAFDLQKRVLLGVGWNFMPTIFLFLLSAFCEIAGCYAFWAWLRLGKSAWWQVPGVCSLAAFAILLTRADSDFAGRAYAAYGGVYIVASLAWLWGIEGRMPDRWDLLGALICFVGALAILFGPRGRQ